MEKSIILQEDTDPNYEPSIDILKEYAEFIGLPLPEENNLLYLAREALKTPLPNEWKACKTEDNQIYFFNFETGESIWEHPNDIFYKKRVQVIKEYGNDIGLIFPEDNDLFYLAIEAISAELPREWISCHKDERTYYFNTETEESTWENPCLNVYRRKVKEVKETRKN